MTQAEGPLQVTEDTVDPDFAEPFVETDEEREGPVPHHYVNGGFKGTDARFSFYFPCKAQYRGRFFHNTYPMAITSDIGPFPIEFEVATGDLGFTLDSGAAYVQTNNGAVFRNPAADPAIAAYRVNAAAAKFFREVAVEKMGGSRPFGYLFGGSGGAYQTMGAAENTRGVWDGFVPFVPGCDHAIPSMFTMRMHALRVLNQRPEAFAGIADAIDAGGSGDPYAHLTDEEAAALREAALMGFTMRGWYDYEAMDSGYFANISGMIPMMDPTYNDDFWSKPGYLGTDPSSRIGEARASHETTVGGVTGGPPFTIELDSVPSSNFQDAHLVMLSGAAKDSSLPVRIVEGNTVHLIATADPAVASQVAAGDKVRLDNSWAMALQTYHRHQLPPDPAYYGWNQFRDENDKPIYPQRDVLVGPAGTINSAGSMLAGDHDAKMLMLAVLLDIDTSPWQADWYRSQVEKTKGADYKDNYALWYVDNGHHENPMRPIQRTHAVSYGGALQQALRDLARWVEDGVRPSETQYEIVDTQIVVPDTPAGRGGVQPVIELNANGSQRADVAAGETVTLSATVAVPPGMGKVVSAEWDFDGAGEFPDKAKIGAPAETVTIETKHAWDTPGTHFAVLRVASQREGDPDTPYGRVQNIARVRVVVS